MCDNLPWATRRTPRSVPTSRVAVAFRLFAIALLTVLTNAPVFAQGPQHPPSAPVTVVNTAANPVPVTGSVGLTGPVPVVQSGTCTVTAQETFAPGRQPKRFGPIDVFQSNSFVGTELVPPVAAGQTFILTHLNVVWFSNNSAIGLVRGACSLQLRVGSTYTPFMLLPLVSSSSALAVTQETFLPVAASEGLDVLCGGVAADGTSPSQQGRVTAAGYFVPAAPAAP